MATATLYFLMAAEQRELGLVVIEAGIEPCCRVVTIATLVSQPIAVQIIFPMTAHARGFGFAKRRAFIVTTAAWQPGVQPPQDKVRISVNKQVHVQSHNLRIASPVIAVTGGTARGRRPFIAAVKAFATLDVGRYFLMTFEATGILYFGTIACVASATLLFRVGVISDQWPRHNEFFDARSMSRRRHQQAHHKCHRDRYISKHAQPTRAPRRPESTCKKRANAPRARAQTSARRNRVSGLSSTRQNTPGGSE